MSFLGGLINAATNAVGTNENAQANAAKSNMAAALQRFQLQRQDQQDLLQQAIQDREAHSQALKDQLVGVQTEAERYKAAHPLIDPNSPDVFARRTEMERQKIIDEKNLGYHAPVAGFEFMQGSDPATGQPYIIKGNKFSGQTQQTDAGGKPLSGGRGGGGASGAQVPVADMEQRYQEIAGHANDLAAGKWKMTSGMQTREGLNYANAVGNAAGHPDITHQFLAGTLNTLGAGGADYTKYQALLNSTRALGDDVAKVFKGRQNEQSVLREVALSEFTPDDYNNPQVVKQKLSRLQHIIALAKLNNPGQEGLEGTPAAPSAGGGIDPATLAAIKAKHGLD